MLIVGAGFAGSVVARQLAEAGKRVTVIDKRPHVGGNAYDCLDPYGVMIHPYGPHLFHTNSKRIWNYLSQFTEWRLYENRSMACVDGVLYPFPINRTTFNRIHKLDFDERQMRRMLVYWARKRAHVPIVTSNDVALNSAGRFLTDKFFRGYSKKMWGRDLSELDPSVLRRVPVRTSDDDRTYLDLYQGIPLLGYTEMFNRMLDHPNIEVILNTPWEKVLGRLPEVWTGPIDEFFHHCLGPLPYRSIEFVHKHFPNCGLTQSVAVLNYPGPEVNWTRATEFRHITGQEHTGTSICWEYPGDDGEPAYPVPCPEGRELYNKYAALAAETPITEFVGRMAQYRYYNMDQAVGAALSAAKKILG